jgi:hypothetical protein
MLAGWMPSGTRIRKGNDMADFGDMAKNALNSDKGEQASDAALDKAGDAAGDATGGRFDEQIDKGKDAADERLGQ